jgi:hypothetical protein
MSTSDALIADASLIDIGWSIWSRTIVDHNGEPVGGVVCEYERRHTADPDTGEITDRVVYRVRSPYGGPLAAMHDRIIGGDDIDVPDGIEPINRARCNLLARRICAALAKRSGPLGGTELSALRDAVALQLALSS